MPEVASCNRPRTTHLSWPCVHLCANWVEWDTPNLTLISRPPPTPRKLPCPFCVYINHVYLVLILCNKKTWPRDSHLSKNAILYASIDTAMLVNISVLTIDASKTMLPCTILTSHDFNIVLPYKESWQYVVFVCIVVLCNVVSVVCWKVAGRGE